MRKLVTSGAGGSAMLVHAIQVALLMLVSLEINSQGCVMSCPPNFPPVQLSLDTSCTDTVTYADLGVTLTGCTGETSVDIMVNGNSIGDVINSSMIGDTFMVVITNDNSGQSCMTMMIVVDKQVPIVNCPPDVTVSCTTDLSEYSDLDQGDIADCSGTQIFIEDSILFSGNCVGSIISRIQRHYIVVDAYLNATTCTQIISLTKANLVDVEFPPDLVGLDAFDCFPIPDVSPAITGFPSVDGSNILNGTVCNLSAGFMDTNIPICSGSHKVMRIWTVVDWCNNNATRSDTQFIEVLDRTPPVVDAPDDFVISTSALSCTADVLMPAAVISDDCSTIINVRMSGPFGTIFSNGGLIPALPVGTHRIIYTATSDCQLEGRDTTFVTVQDLQPPVPICNQNLVIPVNDLGTAIIPAYIFNSASYDNCGQVYFKVRRMSPPVGFACANAGNPNNLFDDFVQLCCQDIANNPIMIVLRVYDVNPVAGPVAANYLEGHFNDCMIVVQVQDKLPPHIICPSNLTISCEFPYTPANLDVFGSVVLTEAAREQICIDDPGVPGDPGLQCIGLDGLATDNCHVTVTSTPNININNCGLGTITRTFTATDDGGVTATCVQTITVVNFDPITLDDITWPSDLTTFDICEIDLLDPDSLEAPYNEPVIADGPCDLVGITYEDDVYDFSNNDQACFKILRTWKVLDWCQYVPPVQGLYTHIQVIKVMNNVPPVINGIEDISECSYDPQCGGLELNLDAEAEDDCSGPGSLTWKYYVDVDNDNDFDYTSVEIIGANISFNFDFPIGTHRVVYTVWDLCGNMSTEEQIVSIVSCKAPSAKCIHGLSTNLMAMDTDGDGEADWGMVSIQASMFDAGSDHPCGNPISIAFSADPLDDTHVFDCNDLGENEVEIWAIDQNGLTDFCITTIDIQDNNHICPPGNLQTGTIAGNISVPNAGKLSGAMVYLDGSNQSGIPTGVDGYFVFPAMPLGGTYHVRPVREGDARNGVTTIDMVQIQKHLLGLKLFANPYQYIAADVNNSGSITAIDIVQLRKLILGIYTEFPSNKSWRFIDQAHIFPDPNNPWLTTWPETYDIIPFSSSMNDADFSAVKIGDLNLNASRNAGNGSITPRSEQRALLRYEVQSQPQEGVYRVDVYLEDADQYEALQVSLDWDQKSYALMDWAPGSLLTADDFRMPEKHGDVASIATFSVNSWPKGRLPVMTLWIRKNDDRALPFHFYLKPGPTAPLAYTVLNDEERNVTLEEVQLNTDQLQNRPNPFRDVTTIYMQSTFEETATLRIYDMSGKEVHNRIVKLLKGENEIFVHKSDLRNAGMYVYEIESNFQYRTNRMIIVN